MSYAAPYLLLECGVGFENLIGTKKSDPSDLVEFHKIRYNSDESDWRRFCTIKNQKNKNQSNLPINWTELAKF
jgi:hypothetical protein